MGFLTEEQVREARIGSWSGGRTVVLLETDSTNIQCRRLAEEGSPEGTLVVAERQTAGKGRRGRSWQSPAGTGVWMSLLLRPGCRPETVPMLTLVAALAVERGIREATGLASQIKWPNDLVLNRKKICGILLETRVTGGKTDFVVAGIGINANIPEFPEELREKATSLYLESGEKADRAALIGRVTAAFEEYYRIFLESGDLTPLLSEYNERLVSLGGAVRVLDPKGEYGGTCLGINAGGELLVKGEDGQVTAVVSGEVSVRGVYGYV